MCPVSERQEEVAAQAAALTRLVSTFCYTCPILAARYPPAPLHSHFPTAFLLAYKRWCEDVRGGRGGLKLREISEELLTELSGGKMSVDSSLAMFVPGPSSFTSRASGPGEGFCRLVDMETGMEILSRLYHLPSLSAEHQGLLFLSPACLNNVSHLLRKNYEDVLSSQYTLLPCEPDHSPSHATHAVIRGLRCPLLDAVPLADMDLVITDFFRQPRLLHLGAHLCVDLNKHITCDTAHLFSTVDKLQKSRVHFYVEEVEGGPGDEVGVSDPLRCHLVSSAHTRLSQGSHASLPFSPQSLLTNFSCSLPELPSYLTSQLGELVRLCRRGGGARLLLDGEAGAGQQLLLPALAARLGHVYRKTWARELVGDTSGATEALVRRAGAELAGLGPHVWALLEVETLGRDREGREDARAVHAVQQCLASLPGHAVVVATSSRPASLPPRLAALFTHQRSLSGLQAGQRAELLGWLAAWLGVALQPGLCLAHWAAQCPGFQLADLTHLLEFAQDEAGPECEVTGAHLAAGLTAVQRCRADSLGLARVPTVRWEEVGGLGEARAELLAAVANPEPGTLHRQAGVLLYGPPGVGKTLLAKAVATECQLSFLSVKGPELLDQYVGQSEQNVVQVFNRAKEAQPCIVFFDEVDSLAPARGGAGDGGGVMDRVVAALLTQLDLLEGGQVTVMAATNRPDLLDPALLRPGRFDRLVYIGPTRDPDQQLSVLQALTRGVALAGDCRLDQLPALLPPGLTGADLSSLVSRAALAAATRTIASLERGEEELGRAEVTWCDFLSVLEDTRPSVSQEQLKSYEQLGQSFRK